MGCMSYFGKPSFFYKLLLPEAECVLKRGENSSREGHIFCGYIFTVTVASTRVNQKVTYGRKTLKCTIFRIVYFAKNLLLKKPYFKSFDIKLGLNCMLYVHLKLMDTLREIRYATTLPEHSIISLENTDGFNGS